MLLTRRSALFAAGASIAAGCTQTSGPQDAANADSVIAPINPDELQRNLRYRTARTPLPFAVQEIYPALHMNSIHLAGGLLGEGGRVVGVSDRHISYHPEVGAAERARLPEARHHPHAVSHKGRLYLLGGFGTNRGAVNWIMSADTLRYEDSGDSWTSMAPAPAPHAEVVAASIGERIHVAGGRKPKAAANLAYGDHEDTDRHLVYDAGSDAWDTAAPALSARNSAAGAVIRNAWHVVGGRSVAGGPSDAHEVYDPREDRWRNAAPMPKGSGAGGNAAGAVGDRLYVFGGEYFDNGGRVHPEAWEYDPAKDTWAAMPPMPTPRHGLGAVVIANTIWLVGGAKKPSGVETSDAVEGFDVF